MHALIHAGQQGKKLTNLGLTALPHPLYSPDLAASDIHLFGPLLMYILEKI